jgi:uncharacterized protein (UPF0332 family)
MSEPKHAARQEVRLYIEHAYEMLDVAALNSAEGYHGSAINRAYYAIFYAANGLLATQGLARSKHAGVIAAFRERFVKPGLIEAEYSRIYGRVMDNRHASDYEIELSIDAGVAEKDLSDARRFVERAEQYLRQEGWL